MSCLMWKGGLMHLQKVSTHVRLCCRLTDMRRKFLLFILQRILSPHCVICQSEWTLNPFQNKPWFLRVCSTRLLKTLWEKEKLLVTSNFFFSHSVFYPSRELSAIFTKFEIVVCKLFQFGRVLNLLLGKGLIM